MRRNSPTHSSTFLPWNRLRRTIPSPSDHEVEATKLSYQEQDNCVDVPVVNNSSELDKLSSMRIVSKGTLYVYN